MGPYDHRGLGLSGDLADLDAHVQGVGLTETGSKGTNLQAPLKTLSNEDCEAWMTHNSTSSSILRNLIQKHLPSGLSELMMCTRGVPFVDEFGDISFTVSKH